MKPAKGPGSAKPGKGCKECEIPSRRGERGRGKRNGGGRQGCQRQGTGEEPSYGASRAGVQIPPPLPRLAPRMFPPSPPCPSSCPFKHHVVTPVPSSLSSSQRRPPPALRTPLLQCTFPTTHPPAPLSHLRTPPYSCSLPPFFIFTPIPSPDLQYLETPPAPTPVGHSPLPPHTLF